MKLNLQIWLSRRKIQYIYPWQHNDPRKTSTRPLPNSKNINKSDGNTLNRMRQRHRSVIIIHLQQKKQRIQLNRTTKNLGKWGKYTGVGACMIIIFVYNWKIAGA